MSFNRFGGINVWEPIFVYGKTKKRIVRDEIDCIIYNFTPGPERNHPCPKPIKLITTLLDYFSKEGDIILDPFLGSGTTTIAARNLNRKYIGIEIVPEYCEISSERLRQKNLF